jgi:hypothetical protein
MFMLPFTVMLHRMLQAQCSVQDKSVRSRVLVQSSPMWSTLYTSETLFIQAVCCKLVDVIIIMFSMSDV